MSDTSDLGSGVGDDSAELYSSTPPRHRARKLTPATQVYDHFKESWDRYISTPEGRYHNMAVLIDTVPGFKKRVKDDLIDRDGRSVEDINRSIDLFLHDLGARVVGLKPGQEVWKKWWVLRAKYLARATASVTYAGGKQASDFGGKAYRDARFGPVDRPREQS